MCGVCALLPCQLKCASICSSPEPIFLSHNRCLSTLQVSNIPPGEIPDLCQVLQTIQSHAFRILYLAFHYENDSSRNPAVPTAGTQHRDGDWSLLDQTVAAMSGSLLQFREVCIKVQLRREVEIKNWDLLLPKWKGIGKFSVVVEDMLDRRFWNIR